MRELLRHLLTLGLAAAVATLIGALIAWWMEEPRRLARIASRVLGGTPDGLIVAQGRAAAAAFRLDAGKVLVMRNGGADALLYPLAKLIGAELLVDEQVVARVAEGEPRRLLDRIPASAEHVSLRLIFDDARHPDFSLDLWLPTDAGRRHTRPAPIVIQEARGWLTRAEALLRRKASPPAVVAPPAPPPSPPPAAATAAPSEDGPPWDDDPPWEEPIEAPPEDDFELAAHDDPEPTPPAEDPPADPGPPGRTEQLRLF